VGWIDTRLWDANIQKACFRYAMILSWYFFKYLAVHYYINSTMVEMCMHINNRLFNSSQCLRVRSESKVQLLSGAL